MTRPSLRQSLRSPLVLLSLAAGLIAFAIQSGELGTADTTHRLQSAHAFWTSEPPVFPNEFPEFGVHGRNGSLQSWYGIGQSLLMLPADIAGTWVEHWPIFAGYYGNDPAVRSILVAFSTNILLSVLTALICFRFLRQFDFCERHAILGTLALLLLTTHLHYTQNMMENNYIFLLTLAGLSWQYEWFQSGSRSALAIGSAAFGLNLLTRLTTGLDLIAGGLFILLILLFQQTTLREIWRQCRIYLATALPIYAFFILLDRLYQFYRFGSFFNTYVSVVAKETLARNPNWPKNYPFETPFHVGLVGALFTPEKSIFLFDPLLILAILLALIAWKRFTPAIKAYTVTTLLLLLAYICFYARYTVWSGDDAWGDRYVSTSVEFAAMLAIPLLLRHRRQLPAILWPIGMALAAISAIVQAASLAFWLPLELYQLDNFGYPIFTIGLRIKNIAAFALGKMDAWGLNTPAMHEDAWDYAHIDTWNFFPFLLRRVGASPQWVVHLAFTLWTASLTALAWTLWRLRNILIRQSTAKQQ